MKETASIDLHPSALPGAGPEAALAAAREFLREQLARRQTQARIITGLGLHGDGTPRLRRRVESEVLPAFQDRIAETYLEQGGAVIRVVFKKQNSAENPAHARQLQKESRQKAFVAREERLGVAGERLDKAEHYLEEGDLRRAKLKIGQLLREFLPSRSIPSEEGAMRKALEDLEKDLKAKGL